MKKNSLIQFVCFITQLELEEFHVPWGRYAKSTQAGRQGIHLYEATGKEKFRYISRHEWPDKDFRYSFMQGRTSEHFPEQKVKVVQAGGYIPIKIGSKNSPAYDHKKAIAFIGHNDNDIDFYRRLNYRSLDIYQAYYESCSYNYILEFEAGADTQPLLELLNNRSGVEAGLYRECIAEPV